MDHHLKDLPIETGDRIVTSEKITPELFHWILSHVPTLITEQTTVIKITGAKQEWHFDVGTEPELILRKIAPIVSTEDLQQWSSINRNLLQTETLKASLPLLNLNLIQPAKYQSQEIQGSSDRRGRDTQSSDEKRRGLESSAEMSHRSPPEGTPSDDTLSQDGPLSDGPIQWRGVTKLEHSHDFSVPGGNILTLKKVLRITNSLEAESQPYEYQVYLTLTSSDLTNVKPGVEYYLNMVHEGQFVLQDKLENFRIYSDIYNLLSKNEFMADQINYRINGMDKEYKRKLERTVDPNSITRDPVFERVHLTTKIPVVDLEWAALSSVLCDQSDYCITEKADGQRTMLYIDAEGQPYFTGFGSIESLPLKTRDYTDCLFDGELVETVEGKIYLIFDCFFINGVSLLHLPLFNPDPINCEQRRCRYNYQELTELCQYLNKQAKMVNGSPTGVPHFDYKKYFYGKTCQEQVDLAKTIYTKDYPYNLDGLILTNYTLSIPEMLVNRSVANFRWKPIKHLSIDVLVRLERNPSFPLELQVLTSGTKKYVQAHLFGRDPQNYHQLVKVKTTLLPLQDEELRTLEEDPIYDSTVIEFVLTETTEGSEEVWLPLRGRPGKTKIQMYDRVDKIEIIETAAETATESKLFEYPCGASDEPTVSVPKPCTAVNYQPAVLDQKYFFDNPYENFVKVHYLKEVINLNNLIKFNLIYPYFGLERVQVPGDRPMLVNYLDLACGRANDYYIWHNQRQGSQTRVNFYLGIDLDPKNIKTAKDLARQVKLGRKYQFVQGDLLDPNLPNIIQGQLTEFFPKAKAAKKFNIISCQFALHYLASSTGNLQTFLGLCNQQLYRDGVLIFTAFDGGAVHHFLKGTWSRVAYSEMGDLLWKLEKRYPYNEPLKNAGQKIHFTMQSLMGFRPSEEYLLNFNYLHQELTGKYSRYRFTRIESRRFSEIVDSDTLFANYVELIRQHCQVPRYLELNYEELRRKILGNPYLYQLASLYRFAIYRKI